MSSSVNLSYCYAAEGFAKYVPYNIVTLFQIVIAGISIPLVFYNAILFYRKRGTIHKNFLIIYMNGFIHYGVHCMTVFIYGSTKQIHSWTYTSPCDLLIVNYGCVIYRCICYTTLFGFSLSHVSMSIERALATFYLRKYERMGYIFGILLTIFMWFIALSSNVYVFWNYFFGLQQSQLGDLTYTCVSVGRANENLIMHYIMLAIDGTATVSDIVLLKINKTQETKGNIQNRPTTRGRISPLEYNLSKRYQVSENFSTIRTMIPVVTTHSIIFTFYLACALMLRFINLTELYSRVTIYEFVFFINTIYVLAIMIVILKAPIGKKQIETTIFLKTNETSMYFQMFQQQMQ